MQQDVASIDISGLDRQSAVQIGEGPFSGSNCINAGSCLADLPTFDDGLSDEEIEEIVRNATEASNFLKALAHEGRLLILCHLVSGEKSVTELERLLNQRQAAVSQQLARLRHEGLVTPRREGKTIYYSLTDPRARKIIEVVYALFCA